tara:strand:+ start:2111 stop:2752 length:642 start_codon:yes stop_codon:yes gene_type:complete
MTHDSSVENAKGEASKRRILEVFEREARIIGPKGVVMAELVRELGISTRTLYKHFANKGEMVEGLIKSWAALWLQRQNEGLESDFDARSRIERGALNWLEHHSRFSELFWLQLERDFPAAHGIYRREHQAFLRRSRTNLMGEIRAGLNPDLALSSLMALMAHAGDPKLCDQLNLTRKDALLEAIDLWARGALKTPLQSIDPGVANPTPIKRKG